MKKYIVTTFLFIAVITSCSYYGKQPIVTVIVIPAKTIEKPKMKTVAIIDTGLEDVIFKQEYRAGICKFGHKDFTGTGLNDVHGHGTNVSGLIEHGAHGANYCQVIIKYYDAKADGRVSITRFIAAIRYAIALKVDYINISGGGTVPSEVEKMLINQAIKQGIVVIAAAGNNSNGDVAGGADIDFKHYYPASYNDRIYVVGNGTDNEHHAKSSNYGNRVDVWRNGENRTAYGITMTGTSQATAIFTGEKIKEDSEE